MDYNSPVPANQSVRCVSYALSVIQDCLAAIQCSTQSELNKQTFRDRIELFSKQLPEANDPIWQTDMFKIYFPKFLELTNR